MRSTEHNPLSRAERETTIRRAADQDSWTVYSDDPVVIAKLTRLHGEGEAMGQWGRSWILPLRSISLRKGTASPRTARQLEAIRKMHATRGSGDGPGGDSMKAMRDTVAP